MSELGESFCLDPGVTFLNHGSFGACPRLVLEAQAALRERMESEPVRFFVHEMPPLLDAAREALGRFIGADADDLAFVPNATAGVNAVLRSLVFAPGDELVVTDHEYNACRNALDWVAARSGARVVVVALPFPIADPAQALEPLLAAVGPRTRLILIDHVTSPTALVLPLAEIVRELSSRDIDVLCDGAHAPGMLDLDVASIGAAYYAGNCHKWMCAPKGAGFLYVRRDKQAGIHPIATSHGLNSPRTDVSRFRLEFDWTGTTDPTAALCVPEAIRTMESLMPGGWPAIREHNHALALEGRRILCQALSVEPPCPDAMIGSMATLPLPIDPGPPADPLLGLEPLGAMLFDRFRVEVPIFRWAGKLLVRHSAQLYNERRDFERLAVALRELTRG